MKYWTRQEWLKLPEARRKATAKLNPLAWILEFEPTILLPGKGYIPLDPWPFQQEFLNCRERFRAINKPRQCGISTIAAAEAAWEFDNVPGAQIVIISKDKDAATNFHKYVRNILQSVRRTNPDAPALIKDNETETTNENGARIKSLAAGKEAGRSFSATHLYFDELAFVQYADDIWQAASATLAQTKGKVTAISTPKGKANLFFTIFDSPPQKDDKGRLTGLNEMGFKTFNYAWWDVPTYNPFYDEYVVAKNEYEKNKTPANRKAVDNIIARARAEGEWYRTERPKYTKLAWMQEFEGAFDANKGTAFSTRSLERCFKRNWLKSIDDPEGLITVWYSKNSDAAPEPGRIYATGTDLGRKRDPMCLITYDVTDFDPTQRDEFGRITAPAVVVDYKWIEPGELEYSQMGRIAKAHFKLWHPDAQHDATGSGDSFSESVEGYSDPYVFTKDSKRRLVDTAVHAFDYGAVRLPKIAQLFREHQKYEYDDEDIVQDTVMANALALMLFYDGGTEGIMLGFRKVDITQAVPA